MPEKTIKSLEKAIDLLFLFDTERRVIDVKTMAARLRLPLRTTYRFVNTLRKQRVLILEDGTGRCRLSPRWRRLLAAIEESGDITRLSGPFLADLARETGETAQLMVLSGDEAVLVDAAESPHPLRVGPPKGRHIPLHCGAGAKVLLAFRSPEEVEGYIRRSGLKAYAPNTVTDPDQLKSQLRAIRRTRFAVSHQEYVQGARAVGVPIEDPTGAVTASLGLVGPDSRLTSQKARELKPLMLETARRISMALAGES